jgi:maltose-binding protein MalE
MKRNYIMKINRYLIILLVIFSLLLSGCDLAFNLLEDNPTFISIWHPFVDGKAEGVQFAADSFMELNPLVNIEVYYVPYDNLLTQYQDAVADNKGPDILIGADDWGPKLDLAELIAPLTGVNTDDLNQASIATGIYQGYQIGIPYSLEGVVLYRNKTIQPIPATTYTDLVEKAKAATTDYRSGALLEIGHLYSLAHLNAQGGVLMTDKGLPAFDSPEAVAWMQMLIEFKELGAAPWYSDNDLKRFKRGKAGWIIDGTWSFNEAHSALGDDLAIDLWPQGMSGYVMADMIYLNPNTSTMERLISKEFIQYLVGYEAQTASSLFDPDFIPVNMAVEPTNRYIKDMMTALSGGESWIAKPEMDEYWGPMETAIRSVLEDGSDPLVALQLALDIIDQTLEPLTD